MNVHDLDVLELILAQTDGESFVADGALATIVLPLCIVLIMISMGMTLTSEDFRRVLSKPKEVLIGLGGQMLLLPAIGFAIAAVFPLDPVFAVSIVLLAAAPGGTTSNLIVHAADGDRALSVTLTSLSNLMVWITMPLLLALSFDVFDYDRESVDFPIGQLMVSVAALTIVPVAIGMAVRRWKPDLCARLERASKIFASVFLGLVVTAIVITNWSAVTANVGEFAPAFIALNIVALGLGYGVARALRVRKRQSSTIAIEMGLQNSTLALTIATSVLNDSELAIIPGLYGVWMLFTGFAFAWFMKRNDPAAHELVPAN